MTITVEMDAKQYGLGFFEGVEAHYPADALAEGVKALALTEEITAETTSPEVRTLLLVKVLKELTYHDFKRICHYLFAYQRQTEAIRAELLEATPELFHLLKTNPEAYFN